MGEITTDPFTAVHDELWGLFEDSSDFTTNVKAGNRIKYIGKRDPEKQEVLTEDFTECRLLASGMQPHLQRTSNSSSMQTRWSVEIRTGEKDLSRAQFPIIWAVYRALAPWEVRLMALTWNGNRLVNLARPVDEILEGIERGEVSRGIAGWFNIWTIEVDLWFKTSEL